MTTVNYTYGCKQPRINGDRVDEQFRLAHRYGNTLVEIERRRRTEIDDARRLHHPRIGELELQYAELTAQIDALYAAIKARNAKARRRTTTPAEREQIATLKAERRKVSEMLSVAKKVAFTIPPEVADMRAKLKAAYNTLPAGRRSKHKPAEVVAMQARLDQHEQQLRDSNPFHHDLHAIEQRAAEAVKLARKNSGLGWGTYLHVEASQSPRTGPLPKFKRWTGDGTIAVQLQGGLSGDDAFSCEDSRLQIDPLPDSAWDDRRATTKRTSVRLRICSDDGEPVMAEVSITMHRPLPLGAQIKWAYLIRRRVAQKNHWQIMLTLDIDRPLHDDHATTGRVGVDVGWRLRPDGLRVAYWCGDDGRSGELVIPEWMLDKWQMPARIRSNRDMLFNEAITDVRAWLADRKLSPAMTEASAYIAQWRDHRKLARLMRLIQEELPYDPIVTRLTTWDHEDRRLWKREAHTAKKVVIWRDNLYRTFAATLRRRYKTIAIEAVKWQQLQRLPQPEEPTPDGAIKEYMRLASPYRLQQLLAESASSVDWVPAKHTTMRCSKCGEMTGEVDRASLYHTCGHCGEIIDQDRNAALNLLNSSGAVPVKTL